eukprot:1139477-Pelagomonas_calceolata.AAC.7
MSDLHPSYEAGASFCKGWHALKLKPMLFKATTQSTESAIRDCFLLGVCDLIVPEKASCQLQRSAVGGARTAVVRWGNANVLTRWGNANVRAPMVVGCLGALKVRECSLL